MSVLVRRPGGRGVPRRRVLGAAAAAPAGMLLLGACSREPSPPAAAGLDLVRVNTGLGLHQGREGYFAVGEEHGFFEDEGIALEVLPGEGTDHNLDQLMAGLVEIATVDASAAIIAHARGDHSGFVLAAPLQQRLLSCVMVRESSPLRRPRDLAGTSMAVIPGGTNTVLFPAFARLHGFDPDTVEQVSPPPPSFPALLAAGRVEAIQQFVVAQDSVEAETGAPVRVFPYERVLPEFYGSAWACTAALAVENPDLVRRFCRAALRSLAYAVGHPQEAGELFAAHPRHNPGQPAPAAAAENTLLAPYVDPGEGRELGEWDRDRLVQSAALLRSYGVFDSPVDVDEIARYDLFR